MNWDWTRLPPVMERRLADDLKAALFVFTGAILAYLIFAPGDSSILLGSFIGLALGVVVLNVVRVVQRRRSP